MKIYTNELGHMTNMAAMPIYGKTLKKSSSPEAIDRWPWNLVCSIVYTSTTTAHGSLVSLPRQSQKSRSILHFILKIILDFRFLTRFFYRELCLLKWWMSVGIPFQEHNSTKVRNIVMVFGRIVEKGSVECQVQEWQLCLSSFSANVPWSICSLYLCFTSNP